MKNGRPRRAAGRFGGFAGRVGAEHHAIALVAGVRVDAPRPGARAARAAGPARWPRPGSASCSPGGRPVLGSAVVPATTVESGVSGLGLAVPVSGARQAGASSRSAPPFDPAGLGQSFGWVEVERHHVVAPLEQQGLLVGDGGQVGCPVGLESAPTNSLLAQIDQPERVARTADGPAATGRRDRPQRPGRSGQVDLPDLLAVKRLNTSTDPSPPGHVQPVPRGEKAHGASVARRSESTLRLVLLCADRPARPPCRPRPPPGLPRRWRRVARGKRDSAGAGRCRARSSWLPLPPSDGQQRGRPWCRTGRGAGRAAWLWKRTGFRRTNWVTALLSSTVKRVPSGPIAASRTPSRMCRTRRVCRSRVTTLALALERVDQTLVEVGADDPAHRRQRSSDFHSDGSSAGAGTSCA